MEQLEKQAIQQPLSPPLAALCGMKTFTVLQEYNVEEFTEPINNTTRHQVLHTTREQQQTYLPRPIHPHSRRWTHQANHITFLI